MGQFLRTSVICLFVILSLWTQFTTSEAIGTLRRNSYRDRLQKAVQRRVAKSVIDSLKFKRLDCSNFHKIADNSNTCAKRSLCKILQERVILTLYPDLFRKKPHTVTVASTPIQHARLISSVRTKRFAANSDGSQCCETLHGTKFVASVTEYGTTTAHYPVSLPCSNLYQILPDAKCGRKGECSGECRLETCLMDVLVWDWTATLFPFKFVKTEVPCYCKCVSA